MQSPETAPASRLPLLRPQRGAPPVSRGGSFLAGVASGLGAHLGVHPWILRAIFILGIPTGLGPLLYLWFWVFVPRGNPWGAQPVAASRARLASPLAPAAQSKAFTPTPALLAALVLLILTVVGAVFGPQLLLRARLWEAFALAFVGLILIWGGMSVQAEDFNTPRFLGFAIPGAFLVLFAAVIGTAGALNWGDALRGSLVAVVTLTLLTVGTLPLWVRLLHSYRENVSERARETLRADMAAHLHDSVLQTLALIRTHAEDPAAVMKLARAEERQLRTWLYTERREPEQSLAQQIKNQISEVEDQYNVTVELVCVGDAIPGEWSDALVAAMHEALNNAAKHGSPPIAVYLEISDTSAQCFVRDHGSGFNIDDIPAGHHGVKGSIVERLERHGGRVKIKSDPNGTEIEMEVMR